MAVSFPRASIYVGLPVAMVDRVSHLMNTRLAASSQRTVNSALVKWREVCRIHGWPELILSDDPNRGGKLASGTGILICVNKSVSHRDSDFVDQALPARKCHANVRAPDGFLDAVSCHWQYQRYNALHHHLEA